MVDIFPFKGFRYNLEKVHDMALVATEPYDKIGSEAQERYYDKSPYNIVRVIRGYEYETDNSEENKYARAADAYRTWKRLGILSQDEEPSLYLYEQHFSIEQYKDKVRRGFIAMARIEDSPEKIRPHENTLLGPKADRLNLLRATEANFGQIFVLYPDEQNAIRKALESRYEQDPEFSFTDDLGVTHFFWKVTDPGVIVAVQREMQDKDLFIADGHHRFETAINYRNEQRAKNPDFDPADAYNFCMMTFVAMEDQGLVILPTHRMVKNLSSFDSGTFLRQMGESFEIVAYDGQDEMIAGMQKYADRHSFGLVVQGDSSFYRVTLRSEEERDRLIGKDSPLKDLDVSILHKVILENILGIDAAKLAQQENVFYKRSAGGTIREVRDGNYQLAFLLNPTRVDQVKQVARAGEKMPQKSTDFFPKVVTGLVIADVSQGQQIA